MEKPTIKDLLSSEGYGRLIHRTGSDLRTDGDDTRYCADLTVKLADFEVVEVDLSDKEGIGSGSPSWSCFASVNLTKSPPTGLPRSRAR